MSIYREIEVTRKRLDVCIEYVYRTDDLPIEIKIMDYAIPEGASIIAYNSGKSGEVNKQFCEVNDNVISFTPEAGFFEKGRNELQYRVVHDNRSLFSFMCKVNCEKSYSDDDAEEVASQPTLLEQILTKLNMYDGETVDLPSEEGVKF